MALKMILESLDGLDPAVAKEYLPKDGKFVLDVPDAKSKLDTDKLQNALNAERRLKEEVSAKLAAWGDRKPEEILPILDKVPELEAAATAGKNKLDEKQLEAVVNGRVAPLQRSLEQLTASNKTLQDEVAGYKTKETRRIIFDEVRKVASDTKANPEAYSSDYGGLMLLAERMFTLDSNGRVVVREGIPDVVHGQAVKDVVGELQRQHPYFWPPSAGGGANGSTGNGNGQVGGNPFKANNMSARGEFVEANKNRPEVIKNAMQAAGITEQWQLVKEK